MQDRVKLRKLADAERQEAKERAIKEAMEDAAGGEAMQPGACFCVGLAFQSQVCLAHAPRFCPLPSQSRVACPSRMRAGS